MLKTSEKKLKKKSPAVEDTPKKKVSQEEFEKKILKLSEAGLTSEKIGEALRKEGVHTSEFSKKVSKILKEKDKYVNPDLKNIEEKLKKIRQHYEENKQDKKAMRERDRIFAQLRKLKSYHKIA